MVLVLPVGLTRKPKGRPIVTTTLAIAIGLMAVAQFIYLSRHHFSEAAINRWFATFGFVPANPNFLTILTAPLVHDSVWHLLVNFVGLWLFVRLVESEWKVASFILLSILVQFGAFAVQGFALSLLAPTERAAPLVGISALIAFAMGVVWVRLPDASVRCRVYRGWQWKTYEILLPLRWLIGAWAVWQVGIALHQLWTHRVTTAAWAHLTGFGIGWGLALVNGWAYLAQRERWQRQAETAERQGQWQISAELWQRIAAESRMDEDAPTPWLAAAYAFLQADEPERAKEALEQALKTLHWSDEALERARRLTILPALTSLPPSLLFDLATQLERFRCFEEALMLFHLLSRMAEFQQAPQALLKVIELHWRLGDEEQARQNLHRFWAHYSQSRWRHDAQQLASQIRQAAR